MYYKLSSDRRMLQLHACAVLFALILAVPPLVATQTVVPFAPFSSVELRDGGKVIFHHGPSQRVTLVKGSLDYSGISMSAEGRLVIVTCKGHCPPGYELEIEITTPGIAGISVSDGGTIQSRGSFPRQAQIGVAVSNGGTIDVRLLTVDRVTASVAQGGRIFTSPQTAMFASVFQGGNVTFWGEARVKSSVRGGGVISRGTAAEASKPLSELSPELSHVPPVPALPAIGLVENFRR